MERHLVPAFQVRVEALSKLHIAFALDEAFAAHAAVAMASLMQHNPDHELSILVLHAGLAEETRSKFRTLVDRQNRVSIRFERADEITRTLPAFSRFTQSVYMRFFAPTFLGSDVDRVLYLDADTLINADLSPLWEIDFRGMTVGAVANSPVASNIYHQKRLGLPMGSTFFNNGVMLLNVPQWLARGTTERLMQFLQHRSHELHMPDQDATNMVLGDEILPLSSKWNVQRPIFFQGHRKLGITRKEQRNLIRDPAIVHFTADLKPWHSTDQHPLGHLYRRTRARTPFADPKMARERRRRPAVVVSTLAKRVVIRASPEILPFFRTFRDRISFR